MAVSQQTLQAVRAYIHGVGLGKARVQILKSQLLARKGRVLSSLTAEATHAIVGAKVTHTRLLQALKMEELPNHVQVVSADWLSACFVQGSVIPVGPYLVDKTTPKPSPQKTMPEHMDPPSEGGEDAGRVVQDAAKVPAKRQSVGTVVKGKRPRISPKKGESAKEREGSLEWLDPDSDYVDSGEENVINFNSEEEQEEEAEGDDVHSQSGESPVSKGGPSPKKRGVYMCELPPAERLINRNQHITDKLEELLRSYESSNDTWRVVSYNRAIKVLKKQPKAITTWEEAKALPYVGEKLADKIWEIVQSGHLHRLDHINQEEEEVMKLFMNIHGVGANFARRFVQLGYRTLDDLSKSGRLTRVQQIGLKHYDEFVERMPRSEAAEIEDKVCELAHSINKGLEVITCGSYRRGKETCGDVDCLITHPDGRSHRGVFAEMLKRGKENGFLTDDLSVHNHEEGQSKYLGVCKLPGEERKHRRLDIIVVPYAELPCALVYFTGSAYFNRSMRKKANDMGMSLSERALCTGVIRKGGTVLHKGTPVPVFSEKDVFKALDIPYAEPKDRNL